MDAKKHYVAEYDPTFNIFSLERISYYLSYDDEFKKGWLSQIKRSAYEQGAKKYFLQGYVDGFSTLQTVSPVSALQCKVTELLTKLGITIGKSDLDGNVYLTDSSKNDNKVYVNEDDKIKLPDWEQYKIHLIDKIIKELNNYEPGRKVC